MNKKEIKQYAKEHKCSIREAQRQLGVEPTGNVSVMTDMEDFISNINADNVIRRVDYMDYNQNIDWNKVYGFGMFYNSNNDIGFERSFIMDKGKVTKYGPMVQEATQMLANLMKDDPVGDTQEVFIEQLELQIEQYWTMVTGKPIQPPRQYIENIQAKYNLSNKTAKECAARGVCIMANIWYASSKGWIHNDNYNGLSFNLNDTKVIYKDDDIVVAA